VYTLSIFVQGFPGKSSTHGGLGWSTIALLSKGNQHILVDGGSFGVRPLLERNLQERGLSYKDISTVLLTHTHWDHSVNWTLFPKAEILLGRVDMEWALSQPIGANALPEFYIQELNHSSQLRLIEHGEEIISGITAHQVAGHTPGHIAFLVDNEDSDIVFSGDAAKNRAELLSHTVDMTLDEKVSLASIQYIWELWKRKPGTILIPGHDIPMILEKGEPKYIAKREGAIEAWFGKDLNQVTTFPLTMDSEENA
jgi:N-acyl homoserine lactone hydrolase